MESLVVEQFDHGGVLLESLEALIEGLYPRVEVPAFLLDLLGLAQRLEDGLPVEFVEQHHLQRLLTLADQEEADDLGDAVVEHLNHDVEVAVQPLADLADEELLGVVVAGGGFLGGERGTARRSSLAERYLASLVKTVFISPSMRVSRICSVWLLRSRSFLLVISLTRERRSGKRLKTLELSSPASSTSSW